jgi:hypothetical protein
MRGTSYVNAAFTLQHKHNVSSELAMPSKIVSMCITPLKVVLVVVPQSSDPDANASCTPVPSIAQLSVLDIIIISSFALTDIDDDDLRRTTDVHHKHISIRLRADVRCVVFVWNRCSWLCVAQPIATLLQCAQRNRNGCDSSTQSNYNEPCLLLLLLQVVPVAPPLTAPRGLPLCTCRPRELTSSVLNVCVLAFISAVSVAAAGGEEQLLVVKTVVA